MPWLQTATGRVRTLTAIAGKSGGRVAFRLVRVYVGHLAAVAAAAIRPGIHIKVAQTKDASEPSDSERTTGEFIRLDPHAIFQPDVEKIEQYARFDTRDEKSITRRSADRLEYRDIPYSKYSGEWHFHPGRIGGELARRPLKDERTARIANTVMDCFVQLPNQGLALYYPKTFRLTRLQSSEYIYSAIAQAQLLAGYSRLAHQAPVPEAQRASWANVSRRIAKSLEFPFQQGGVNMEGKVLLEAPNFRAPPEIILNGWMDALIHLHDYLSAAGGNAALKSLFDANIKTLAKLLPHFDDEKLRLSRYSNLSPYRLRVHLRNRLAGAPRICLRYIARVDGFSSYCIDELWNDDNANTCFFENKIVKRTARHIDILASSSSLYDLEVRVQADAARLETSSQPYGIWTAPSVGSARRIFVEPSSRHESASGFHIPAGLLMAGQPTDFAKGFNFYHTYHVVALLELSRMTQDREDRSTLRDFAMKWLDYMKAPNKAILKDGQRFSDPTQILRQLSNGRGNRSAIQFEELLVSSSASS